jgi:hypothetical protein
VRCPVTELRDPLKATSELVRWPVLLLPRIDDVCPLPVFCIASAFAQARFCLTL